MSTTLALLLIVYSPAVLGFLLWPIVRPWIDSPFRCIGSWSGDEKFPVADDLDMRKMMGRWFVSGEFHRRLGEGYAECIIYEFNHLILAHHTTSFDSTLTYRTRGIVQKEYAFLRSSEPINAKLLYFNGPFNYARGGKFWIIKVGPEGRDSFGRLQYEYAIVGGCNVAWMVLIRNPDEFNEKYKAEINDWMANNGKGIRGGPFYEAYYSECYSDSITEVVGASDEGNEDDSKTILSKVDSKVECNRSCDPDNITLAQGFDPSKMRGRFFEGLTSFQGDNHTCIVYDYVRLEISGSNYSIDGIPYYWIKFNIQKSYREAGYPMKKEEYRIETTDRENPKFGTQFWIYKLGPEGKDSFNRVQYEYVIVSNCEKFHVLVLIRNPATFEDMYKKSVTTWLEENNFETGKELLQPDYTINHMVSSVSPYSACAFASLTGDKFPIAIPHSQLSQTTLSLAAQMPTPLALLLLFSAVHGFIPWPLPRPWSIPADRCERLYGGWTADANFPVADDLDMRKMMGRWFVAGDPRSHRRLVRKGRAQCIIYEFDRLILAHHTASFDAKITVRSRGEVLKDFGFMRSSEPRNAMLQHFTGPYYYNARGSNLWIFKVGPEGKDSFGRLQYEYAILGDCDLAWLVLIRNPETFKEKYTTEIHNWLEHNGRIRLADWFNQPNYTDCYHDSVSQVVGASDIGSEDETVAILTKVDSRVESNYSCDSNITLAQGFEPTKMMGRWFEGLTSFPSDNHTCLVHDYLNFEVTDIEHTFDGTPYYRKTFKIQKTFRQAGYSMRTEEYRIESKDRENPKFGSQFWIYQLGPEGKDSFGREQYEYVIVSNCEKSAILVLIRTPAIFEDMHKKSVMTWLEENDFEIGENFVQPDYSSCHYADSLIY